MVFVFSFQLAFLVINPCGKDIKSFPNLNTILQNIFRISIKVGERGAYKRKSSASNQGTGQTESAGQAPDSLYKICSNCFSCQLAF